MPHPDGDLQSALLWSTAILFLFRYILISHVWDKSTCSCGGNGFFDGCTALWVFRRD
ncbi:MAG TPA: hypothetical protein DCM73_11445 [Clostridiales bacterium]|nr:hypothetical protein [Clostridiales bacterium]